MHTLLITLLLCCLSMSAAAKTALVVVHYGTTVAETRVKTIDAILSDIQSANPTLEVREAYIAAMVRSRLEKRSIHKDSPLDAMLRLHLEGYDTIYVQPTLLLDGIEMSLLREDVAKATSFFRAVHLGTPLLYTLDDCRRFLTVLESEQPQKGGAVLWVGHGNALASTATYAMLNSMLADDGCNRHFVSTIEGYPNAGNAITALHKAKAKSVTLIPMLLVCGDHTLNDINGTVRQALTKSGINATTQLKGLGERPEVRQLYVDKTRELLSR